MTLSSYWLRFALIGAQCVQKRTRDVKLLSVQLQVMIVRLAIAQTMWEVLLLRPPWHCNPWRLQLLLLLASRLGFSRCPF